MLVGFFVANRGGDVCNGSPVRPEGNKRRVLYDWLYDCCAGYTASSPGLPASSAATGSEASIRVAAE